MIRKCQHGSYVAVKDDTALYCQFCNYAWVITIIPRRPSDIPAMPLHWHIPIEKGSAGLPYAVYTSQEQKDWEWVLVKSGHATRAGENRSLVYGWEYRDYSLPHPDNPGKRIIRQPFDYTAPNGQDPATFKRAALKVSMLGNKNRAGVVPWNKGVKLGPMSEGTREKLRASMKVACVGRAGHPTSEATKEKLRQSMLRRTAKISESKV
jgi:hypothetical protein